MNKKFTSLLASGALLVAGAAAIGTGAANAGGNVDRYQMQAITITTPLGSQHSYAGTLNPCDGSFTAIETTTTPTGENVTGTLTDTTLTYSSTYTHPVLGVSPYTYTVSAARTGAVTFSGTWSDNLAVDNQGTRDGSTNVITVVVGAATTNYANHGAYVSSAGGGSDAAHSCIGMPIQSQS